MEIGAKLRDARERKGLTQQDIAKATNISLQVLDAIERGDLAQVPGGLFTRAHLRAYARRVGLDPGQVVAEFVAGHESRHADDELYDLRRRYAVRQPSGRGWSYALVIAAGVALLLVSFLVSRAAETRAADPGPTVVPAVEEAAPPVRTPIARLPSGSASA